MFDYEVQLETTVDAVIVVRAKSVSDAENIAADFIKNKLIVDVIDDPAIDGIDYFYTHDPRVEEVVELVDD